MTFGEFSSMLYFLQNRIGLSITSSLVNPWVGPDGLRDAKEIEKSSSLIAMTSRSKKVALPSTKNFEHQNN